MKHLLLSFAIAIALVGCGKDEPPFDPIATNNRLVGEWYHELPSLTPDTIGITFTSDFKFSAWDGSSDGRIYNGRNMPYTLQPDYISIEGWGNGICKLIDNNTLDFLIGRYKRR